MSDSFYSSSSYDSEDDYGYMYNVGEEEVVLQPEDFLPDPSKDKHAILLGEFSLQVKAASDYSITELQHRLISNGVLHRPGATFQEVCLDNLFNVSGNSQHKAKFLTFDLPDVREADSADEDDRVQIVPVDVLLPGLRSMSMLVELPPVCTAAEARDSIKRQLSADNQLPNEPQAVVLLWMVEEPPAVAGGSSNRGALVTAVEDGQPLEAKKLTIDHPDDDRKERLIVCWLPKKPASSKGKQPATPAGEAEQHYSQQYALVQFINAGRRSTWLQLMPLKSDALNGGKRAHNAVQSELRDFLISKCRHSWMAWTGRPAPAHELHVLRSYEECTPSRSSGRLTSKTSAASLNKAGPISWIVPDLVAHLFVEASIPLGCEYQLEPPPVENAIQQMLEYTMDDRIEERYQRNHRRQKRKLQRRLPLYDVVSELRTAAQKVNPEYGFGNRRPVIAVKLTLDCPDPTKPRLGTATFKVYTWPNATAAHGSVLSDPTSLSASANTIKEGNILMGFFGGTDIIPELADGIGSDSDSPYWRQGVRTMHGSAAGSSAAATAAAAAPSNGDSPAAGTSSGAAAAAATLAEAKRLAKLYRTGSKVQLPLRMTLRLLGAGQPQVEALYGGWMESLDKWGAAEKSVKGLLDMLRTGPCEPAPQPEGLAVPLRPHQLQSLARMLEREQAPLGFNSLLWTKLESAGRDWWISLVLNKLSMNAPPVTVTGGFLCDEMGLGKTITILGLILANPAPEVHTAPAQTPTKLAAAAATTPTRSGKGRGKAGPSKAVAAAAAGASSSNQAVITRPGERLPGSTGAAASRRGSTRNGGSSSAAAPFDSDVDDDDDDDEPAAGKGKKGSKRKRSSTATKATNKKRKQNQQSAPDEADSEAATSADASDAMADHAAAAAAAPAAGRGRGRGGRGSRGGRGGGRSARSALDEVVMDAVEKLLGGTVDSDGVVDAIEQFEEQEAAAALPSVEGRGLIYSCATLVVCAVSLVGQWMDEAVDKTHKEGQQGSLKLYKYHGPNRDKATLQQLAADYDVVVTTYPTLVSDRSLHDAPPLEQIKWWRVVFDEGHTLKNKDSSTTKAAVAINAPNRWVVTGTPIGGDMADLAGQFAALQLWPFNVPSWFQVNVKHPFTRHMISNPSSRLCSPLPLVHTLRHLVTRHTKDQQLSGQAVLTLPEKTVVNVPVVLNVEEAAAYKEVYAKARAIWVTLAAAGPQQINRHILAAMSLLLPQRRICSGGRLSNSDMQVREIDLSRTAAHLPTNPEALAAAAAATSSILTAGLPCAGVSAPDDAECVVCLDCLEVPVVTPCGHWFCKECIIGALALKKNCPLCRAAVSQKDLKAGMVAQQEQQQQQEDWDAAAAAAAGGREDAARVVVCDSKLKVLLKELAAMRASDPSSKALVFTQYNSTLEWLKKALPAAGFDYRSITGSMPLNQRTKAIEMFQRDPPTTVFLLSVRSGAVGINLTAANHVFLLEPCLNPALEEQAIGRAWRMGQARQVVVKRLFVQGSVEEKIMQLAEARRSGAHIPGTSRWGDINPVAAAAAGAGGRAGSSAAAAAAQQQLAGALKADTQKLRAAELESLFAPPTLPQPAPLPPGPAGAGAAGSSAAAATAAAAADPADMELERQLAVAGLLHGSSRAAAWADVIAQAGTVAARQQRSARVAARRQLQQVIAAAAAGSEDERDEEQQQQQQQQRGRRGRKRKQQDKDADSNQPQLGSIQELQSEEQPVAAAAAAGNSGSRSSRHRGAAVAAAAAAPQRSQRQRQQQQVQRGSAAVTHGCSDDSSSSENDSSSSESQQAEPRPHGIGRLGQWISNMQQQLLMHAQTAAMHALMRRPAARLGALPRRHQSDPGSSDSSSDDSSTEPPADEIPPATDSESDSETESESETETESDSEELGPHHGLRRNTCYPRVSRNASRGTPRLQQYSNSDSESDSEESESESDSSESSGEEAQAQQPRRQQHRGRGGGSRGRASPASRGRARGRGRKGRGA